MPPKLSDRLFGFAARLFPRERTHRGSVADRRLESVALLSWRATFRGRFCGADRDRTDDLRLAKPALSQLSYSP